MAIAVEQEMVEKVYTRTRAQILTVLGGDPSEELTGVSAGDGIICTTQMGSPVVTRRIYRISYPEARTLLGLTDGENIVGIDFGDPDVTINTSRQTV